MVKTLNDTSLICTGLPIFKQLKAIDEFNLNFFIFTKKTFL